jgi:Bardet-Biedl syndrome 9 protein
MSLFSSREWWNTRLGSGEEFDQGCLILANIDNAADDSGELKLRTWTVATLLTLAV